MHCDVMWCPLMWWAVICCELMRCNGMRSYEFVMHCGWLRCHVVWFDMVVWGELEDDLVIRTTQIYSVLHSTTKYYSGTTLYYTVLLQYYSVLQSTTPVLILYYKVILQYYSVLHSTTPVLLCTTKYYSSTTLYYKVLLQYYSVLQSTTPVLRCTTKYYSSAILYYKVLLCTTLYYKVLLQYHSVLQRTTPVLVCTTKYYSSTTPYCKVLLQYYSVLQSTTPVLVCTTKYYSRTNSVLHSTTPLYYKVLLQYYSVLQSTTPVLLLELQSTHLQGAKHQRHQMLCLPRKVTLMIDPRHIWNVNYNAQSNRTHPQTSPNTAPAAEQQVSSTNVTKYCACHEKCLAPLILVTRETSFTMRGTTGITLQPHQMLCLPRKMTRIIDPRDIWNVIYNARSNRHHPPTSPNTAPATQKCTPKSKRNSPRTVEASIPMRSRFDHDPSMIRTWSDHDPSMIRPWTRHLAPARSPRLLFALRRRILYWKLQHFALRLSPQISPNTAPATKSDTPRSPNTAPATKNDSHDWYPWHMKRHLQCAEQQASPCNLTKYGACHAKWLSWLIFVTYGTSFTMRGATGMHHPPTSPNTAPATQKCTPRSKRNSPRTVEASIPMRGRFDHDPSMIRTWSEHDPTMNSSSRTRPFAEVTFRASETHFALKITTFRAPAIYPNFTEYCACHEKWHSKITKCCACHEKWFSWLISVTYETSFTMRGATSITLQPHQILRLPRKMALMIDLRHIWNVIYNARSNRHHPPTSPNTAPATQKRTPRSKRNSPRTVEASIPMRGRFDHDPSMIRTWSEHDPTMNSSSRTRPFAEVTFRASETHFALKITTFRAPAIYPNFTQYCACHEKWHSNITKCCACLEKWHSKITKYCSCHEK